MKRGLEDALQNCLEALAIGRATVEECLARYPDLAASLEPLLRMGQRLQEVYDVEPSPLYAQAAHQRFLAALASRGQRALAAHPRRALWRWAPAALGSAALVTFAVWAVVLALGSGSGTSPVTGGLVFSVPPPAAEAPQPLLSAAVAQAQQNLGRIREAVERGEPVDPVALKELKEANQSLVQGLGAPEVSDEDLSSVEVLLADQEELFAGLGDSVPPDDVEEIITIAALGRTKIKELRSPTPTVTPEASPTPEQTPTATPEATGTPAPTPTPETTPAETPEASPTPEAEGEAGQEATPTPTAAP